MLCSLRFANQVLTLFYSKEREEQVKCNHVKQTAHWLNDAKTQRLKHLYATDPSTALKELTGMIVDDYTPCFQRDDIQRLFSLTPSLIETRPEYVFVAVDPNGGGPSQMAICSCYYNGLDCVIVGLGKIELPIRPTTPLRGVVGRIKRVSLTIISPSDSEPVKTHVEIRNTLRKHLDSINKIPELQNVMKIFIPECNMGNEATHMHAMIADRPDVRTYWQKEDRVGVLKTHELTDNYQYYLNELIKNNWLTFYMYLFTNSRRHRPETIKALLQEQMERYHYAQKDTVDRKTGKPNYSITGKMGHKQDDLLIATMMALYFGRSALRDPRRIR